MGIIFADRVQETTSTAGTGTILLSGAVTGYRDFSIIGNGNQCYYCITDANNAWEVGVGTWTTGGHLTRSAIASTNGNQPINLAAGVKTIFSPIPAVVAANIPYLPTYVFTNMTTKSPENGEPGFTLEDLDGNPIMVLSDETGYYKTTQAEVTSRLFEWWHGGTVQAYLGKNGQIYCNGVVTQGTSDVINVCGGIGNITSDGSNQTLLIKAYKDIELLPNGLSGGTGSLAIGGTGSFGSGKNVIFIANATVLPSTNPSGGGVLYCDSGALKYKGSSGTVTTIAPA